MGRSKRKKAKKLTKPNNNTVEKDEFTFFKKANGALLWLAATGILAVVVKFTFSFLTGDVELNYQKPAGRGYEFKLINMSSTDQVVEYFKIVPDLEHKFVFKTTEDVYAEVTDKGISIPGGNVSYVPAYEFKGMDGYVLSASSDVTFRVPPLTSRSYMTPESIVVFAEYKTKSSNEIISTIEDYFSSIRLGTGVKKIKYLVVENYWTPIGNDSSIDAIKLACRDDDMFGKSSICDEYN